MSEPLLSCPFCGGEAERTDNGPTDFTRERDGGSFIHCTKCDASSALHFDRKENLVDSWNRRIGIQQPNDVLVSRLEALEYQISRKVTDMEEMKARNDLTAEWGECSLLCHREFLREIVAILGTVRS